MKMIYGMNLKKSQKRNNAMKITNGAYIIDSLNKMLFVHPTNHSENTWSIPKGMFNEGETSSKEAAIRETMEETNLNLNDYNEYIEYEDLGESKYAHGNKKLRGHLFHMNIPLSTMDLKLGCISYFTNNKTKKEELECDIVEWKDLNFGDDTLHETQKKLLNKVKNILFLKDN